MLIHFDVTWIPVEYTKKCPRWAVVVAQLAERSLPIPEVDSLKPKSSFFSPSSFITGSQHKIVFFKQDSFTILNEF